MCLTLPVQLLLFSAMMYPSSHRHLADPYVSSHICSHPPLFCMHSLISENVNASLKLAIYETLHNVSSCEKCLSLSTIGELSELWTPAW